MNSLWKKLVIIQLLLCVTLAGATVTSSSNQTSNTIEYSEPPPEGSKFVGDLGMRFQKQCKSTRLLCLEGCDMTGPEAWNQIHADHDIHGYAWCWAASISMVASYYLKNLGRPTEYLSPDLIALKRTFEGSHEEWKPIEYYTLHYRRGSLGSLPWAMGLADGTYVYDHLAYRPTFTEMKGLIDGGHPLIVSYPGHFMAIDGYLENGTGNYIHMLDPGADEPTWIDWSTKYLGIDNVYSCLTTAADVKSDWDWDWNANNIPDVAEDYDGDGIVDLDEDWRFKTDKTLSDSDGDGLSDGAEVRSYMFDSAGEYTLHLVPDGGTYDPNEPLAYMYYNSTGDVDFDWDCLDAIKRRADYDWDGLRMELDPDNDNDNILDGTEDANHNGVYEPELGETSNFHADPQVQRLTFDEFTSKHQRVAVSGSCVHVVWTDGRIGSGNWEIYYAKSLDHGETWEPAVRLTSSTGVSQNPAIAVSGSNVHVVWEDSRTGEYQIWYKRSLDNGTTWLTEQQLSNQSSSTYPAVSVFGTHIHVVWQCQLAYNMQVFYTNSSYNGALGTWDTPFAIGPAPGESIWGDDNARPSIATSMTLQILPNMTLIQLRHVHVVWQTEGLNILYRHSGDDGVSWSPWSRLDPDGATSEYPQIDASIGVVHVVWWDWSVGRPEVYYAKSTNSGGNWNAAVRLTTASGYTGPPTISVSGSRVFVTWEDDAWAFGNETWWRQSADSGITWASSDMVTVDDKHTSLRPDIAADQNIVHVVWQEEKDGNLEIYHRSYVMNPPVIVQVNYTPSCPPPYVPSTTPRINEAVNVKANIAGNYPQGVVLKFRKQGGSWTSVNMVFDETSDLWIETIPGYPESCTVEFDVEATDEYGVVVTSPLYSYVVQALPRADLNGDGIVDIFDAIILAGNYGKTAP